MSFIDDKYNSLSVYVLDITCFQSACFIFDIAHLLNRCNNKRIGRVGAFKFCY